MKIPEDVTAAFIDWLNHQVGSAARGDQDSSSDVHPSGRYWLGRLAPEQMVVNNVLGERGERLEPCAVGMRVRPAGAGPWQFSVDVRMKSWLKAKNAPWTKTKSAHCSLPIRIESQQGVSVFGADAIQLQLAGVCGKQGLSAEVRVECEPYHLGGFVLTVLLVNTSPEEHKDFKDTRLYETELEVSGLRADVFELEALPDSFRYDRSVPAYGVNCGAVVEGDAMRTVDCPAADRPRPIFWGGTDALPDLTFAALAENPIPPCEALVNAVQSWGKAKWSAESLEKRAKKAGWTQEMHAEATNAAEEFTVELERINEGLGLLKSNEALNRAFKLMNKAVKKSAEGKYSSWRPFQIAFILANLSAITNPKGNAHIADVVWFATGGGKTETYLGLLTTAAFYERINGKVCGVTAWSRFPLRMLSLQQVQRFANALAAAELIRREEGIHGDWFSLGFLVGSSSTPNSIKADATEKDQWDADDEAMPNRCRVLQVCPFCRSENIAMFFDRRTWTLQHQCTSDVCPWPENGLPFYVVDDEIYRFLPTVIVGTLDKAASISMQAAMLGLVGPPRGECKRERHGFVYSRRSNRPTGCLVPGCSSEFDPLPMENSLFGITFRLQDELHLLRDSLGAVDSHYESLYDGLQEDLCGYTGKILGSSATLSGYENQAMTLYNRAARVFPLQGPSRSEGLWVSDSRTLMRRFVAVAPRGVTVEYVLDKMSEVLLQSVRRLKDDPINTCQEIGIDSGFAADLVDVYGTTVVYGSTLRDLDAAERSSETQIQVDDFNVEQLTGRTDFEDVREVLRRLENPEPDYKDRLHLIYASSMMSHGVDVDRLNVMVMVGLPLTTAEFIQATARVGRKFPALVFVIHKIGRERDAGIYSSFTKYVEQGDRFVEPVPITRRSRRVLEKTMAGLALARVLILHETKFGKPLTTISALRDYLTSKPGFDKTEAKVLVKYLNLRPGIDDRMINDLSRWLSVFVRNVKDPLPNSKFPSDASPTGRPMLSLRDVEEQVPIHLTRFGGQQ